MDYLYDKGKTVEMVYFSKNLNFKENKLPTFDIGNKLDQDETEVLTLGINVFFLFAGGIVCHAVSLNKPYFNISRQ